MRKPEKTLKNNHSNSYPIFLPIALILLLPLLGAAAAGKSLVPYLQFPPRTPIVVQPPFSWPVFIGLSLFISASIAPLVLRYIRQKGATQKTAPANPFPWWGWAGAALGAVSWIIAWNRFSWVGDNLQAHTFTPLWISFIIVANAFLHRKTGRSLLLSQTRGFLMLFPVSALFWWSFEYLNRFLGNWRYAGGDIEFSAPEYILFATLPFSTVLPAVISIRELIFSNKRFNDAFQNWFCLSPPNSQAIALAAILFSCIGLLGVGFAPNIVYSLVWVAPPLLLISFSALLGKPQALSPIAKGDWRCFVASSFAALFCGFFWEMWNSGSVTKWIYEVPYVDVLHIFEMPLLGYAGYLPFGILCAQIGNLILKSRGSD
ncbi:MAG: hypothetical protein FWH25_01795 [Syntrophorhabdaceae bacterium]|nr:hypothetical protein [Syntrophorhabdaceae bacterium]